MRQDFEKLFAMLTPPEPPAGLFDLVLKRIEEQKRFRAARRQLVVVSLTLLGSFVALFPLAQILVEKISNSGFFEFISLLVTDFGIISSFWQNYLLVLMESLPVLELVFLLAAFLVLLESCRFLIKDIKIIQQVKLKQKYGY